MVYGRRKYSGGRGGGYKRRARLSLKRKRAVKRLKVKRALRRVQMNKVENKSYRAIYPFEITANTAYATATALTAPPLSVNSNGGAVGTAYIINSMANVGLEVRIMRGSASALITNGAAGEVTNDDQDYLYMTVQYQGGWPALVPRPEMEDIRGRFQKCCLKLNKVKVSWMSPGVYSAPRQFGGAQQPYGQFQHIIISPIASRPVNTTKLFNGGVDGGAGYPPQPASPSASWQNLIESFYKVKRTKLVEKLLYGLNYPVWKGVSTNINLQPDGSIPAPDYSTGQFVSQTQQTEMDTDDLLGDTYPAASVSMQIQAAKWYSFCPVYFFKLYSPMTTAATDTIRFQVEVSSYIKCTGKGKRDVDFTGP